MQEAIDKIRTRIEPLRTQIINHPIYKTVKTVDDLNLFMQHHVFAVWDFMSLLKSLQNKLTCTTLPWLPTGHADTRYLINEIVVGEESDVDRQGRRMSHFELYLSAMQQSGADMEQIDTFIQAIRQGQALSDAIVTAALPQSVSDFVQSTFHVIYHMPVYVQAGVFTFGREDLIPAMFQSMVRDLDSRHPDRVSIFKYYLERHIEVDGDHHSHLALDMTARLCGNDSTAWEQVEAAVVSALQHRIALWDGICRQIERRALTAAEAY